MAVALALKSRALIWLGVVTAVSLPIAWIGSWSAVGIFLPYWPMFACGILVYLVLERGVSVGRIAGEHSRRLSWTGLVVLVGAFVAATLASRPTGDFLFGVLGIALWLVHAFDDDYVRGLTHGHQLIRTGLVTLKYLGVISYSLYLLHCRFQFLAKQIVRQVVPSGIALDLGAIALTCFGCYAFYLYCERPFIRKRSVNSGRLAVVEQAGLTANQWKVWGFSNGARVS